MGIDKYNAINNKWRVSEKTLIFSALCFGGVGSLLGKQAFNHKTKKLKFKIVFTITAIYTMVVAVYILIALNM